VTADFRRHREAVAESRGAAAGRWRHHAGRAAAARQEVGVLLDRDFAWMNQRRQSKDLRREKRSPQSRRRVGEQSLQFRHVFLADTVGYGI
jgi:hypothetical protein